MSSWAVWLSDFTPNSFSSAPISKPNDAPAAAPSGPPIWLPIRAPPAAPWIAPVHDPAFEIRPRVARLKPATPAAGELATPSKPPAITPPVVQGYLFQASSFQTAPLRFDSACEKPPLEKRLFTPEAGG